MSSSDNGSPTAARMLMSVQRLEGAGLFATGSLGISCGCVAGAADAVAWGLGLVAGRTAGAGAGADLDSASTGFSFSGASRGTLTERHGVLHGLPSAAACAGAPKSAITVATTAIATRGEEHAG
ncbi:hypothetical protein NU688_11245 [Variovorax sp. ZS18.2.2]|uniref:hypothetical protein n=1 Tax=Variovorax sp. ZS18.2.2 TaxID=2971255 RepID=UPI002150CC7A|nr:hypothetical protein [Variovorax sp. ZS18.2.2]MCR6476722.1 hypothetical protein [Variovorax sp. ZS18.2.2]